MGSVRVGGSRLALPSVQGVGSAVHARWIGPAVLGLAALAVRWPFLHDRAAPALAPDARDYLAMARAVRGGDPYPEGSIPRTPGYAFFVAACDLLPGPAEANVALVQHVLGALLAVAGLIVARRWVGRATAWACGGLLALSPLLFAIEDDVLPDFLVAVLLFGAAVLLAAQAARAARGRWAAWAAALGAVLAAAALVKAVALVALAIMPLALLAGGWAWRRAMAAWGLSIAVAVVVLSPWIVHNAVAHGTPTISGQLGITLFNRVFEVDGRPVPQDDAQAFEVATAGVREASAAGLRLHVAALDVLSRRFDFDSWQAAGAERRIAQDAIADYPLAFLGRTVGRAGAAAPDARPAAAAAAPLVPRAGGSPVGASRAAWDAGELLGRAWWILTLNGW